MFVKLHFDVDCRIKPRGLNFQIYKFDCKRMQTPNFVMAKNAIFQMLRFFRTRDLATGNMRFSEGFFKGEVADTARFRAQKSPPAREGFWKKRGLKWGLFSAK